MGKTTAGVLLILYLAAFLSFSVWFVLNVGLAEPVNQLISFVGETKIVHQDISWDNSGVLFGFILLDLIVSIAAAILVKAAVIRKVNMEPFDKLAARPFLQMSLVLLFFVIMEEAIFRLMPLGILFRIWGTNSALSLWALVITSSLLFGLAHLTNQTSGRRNVIATLPQVLGGVLFSYIFLAFGFLGALLVHFVFDIVILIPAWLVHRIKENDQVLQFNPIWRA